MEKTLIEAHLEAVLDHPASGLTSLIQDSRLDDLKRLYNLFGRVSTGHEALQKGILSWITTIGKQINDGLLVVGGVEVEGPTIESDLKGKGKAREGAPKPVTDTSSLKTRLALSWVQQVLSLKDKFEILLAQAFNSDKAFERSINDVSDFPDHKCVSYSDLSIHRHSPPLSTRMRWPLNTFRYSSTTISRRV